MYEYRCPQCGQLFEKLRRLSEADREVDCPKCGASRAQRVFSVCAKPGGDCGPGSRFT
jgi:putative FmdB family regulatory protein